ncbi:MAG: hypothetical protein AABY14_04545 [Nanoarchaeota archaeon]
MKEDAKLLGFIESPQKTDWRKGRILNKERFIDSFKQFNKRNILCIPIKFIEYELEENNLKFQEVEYN